MGNDQKKKVAKLNAVGLPPSIDLDIKNIHVSIVWVRMTKNEERQFAADLRRIASWVSEGDVQSRREHDLFTILK